MGTKRENRTLGAVTYLKAVIVGVVTGLLAAVLYVVGRLFLLLVGSMAFSGSGGIGAVSVGSGSATLVLLIGFIVGFAWTIKRSRQRQSTAS